MRKIFLIVSIILFVIGTILGLYFKFMNIDMTQTRFFLTYWYLFVLYVPFIVWQITEF